MIDFEEARNALQEAFNLSGDTNKVSLGMVQSISGAVEPPFGTDEQTCGAVLRP